MTEKQLRDLLDVWKGRLGLGRWLLVLELGGCGDATAYMEVNRSASYERAVINAQPWLLGVGEVPEGVMIRGEHLTDEFVEACLVHELLHLHTRDMCAIVRDDCDGLVHPDAYRQLDLAMHRAEEQCVDRLAVALVQAF